MFGQRLKEERTRLGLTQPMLAETVGSAKRTVVDWEQEKSSPTAKQLMAMQGLGVDTNYLLTGVRLNTVVENAEIANYRVDCEEKPIEPLKINAMLNTPELIEHWHKLNDDDKETVLRLVKSLAKGNE